MPVDNRTCFATAEALKKFEPQTLCRFLLQYREYTERRLGKLPDRPNEDNMPYDQITAMFLDTDDETPGDFLEKMALIVEMAQDGGHYNLIEEAKHRNVPYESFRGKTYHDTAMRAAMLKGDLLEQAHARVVLIRKRRFNYYPPFLGEVPEYREPTSAELDALSDKLTLLFHGRRTKIKAKVLLFDFENEAWFLIRRGGQPIRLAVYNDEGDAVSRFLVPEAYDGIVYNKKHGELRIISKLPPELQESYLTLFGELLTGNDQFFGHRKIFFPEKVRDMRHADLMWSGGQKIKEMRLAQVGYQMPGGEVEVLKSKKCLLRRNDHGTMIPEKVEMVLFVVFKFKFLSDNRERSARVDAGCVATYLRDSDVTLIEEWLRDKGIMHSIRKAKHAEAA